MLQIGDIEDFIIKWSKRMPLTNREKEIIRDVFKWKGLVNVRELSHDDNSIKKFLDHLKE